MQQRPGRFITFEGGEGSGKSTQARRLADALKARGLDCVLTREPGGSPFAEVLRKVLLDPATPPHAPLSEALLFYAARADHMAKVVRPALAAGRWVISDRFSDSTRVYQGYAGALDQSTIDDLERIVIGPSAPDLTFIVDVPVSLGLARAASRRGAGPRAVEMPDAYEGRDVAYHERLRKGFLDIARKEPGRCRVIDGARSEAEVAAEILATTEGRLLAKAR